MPAGLKLWETLRVAGARALAIHWLEVDQVLRLKVFTVVPGCSPPARPPSRDTLCLAGVHVLAAN